MERPSIRWNPAISGARRAPWWVAVLLLPGCAADGLPLPQFTDAFSPVQDSASRTQNDDALNPGEDLSTLAGPIWPMRGYTADHRGRSRFVGARSATVRWKVQLERQYVTDSPAIAADGTVYFGASAYDGMTGTKKWDFPGPILLPADSSCSPAIATDGTVYAVARDGLRALDPRDGTARWHFQAQSGAPSVWQSSPVVGRDGTIYFGSGDLFAVDPVTGQEKWTYHAGEAIESTPALGADETLFVGTWGKRLLAIDTVTGREKWTYRANSDIRSSPSVGRDGTVYFASYEGKTVYALDGASGAVRWTRLADEKVLSSPALGEDGTVYIASSTSVLAISAAGTLRWSFPSPHHGAASPAVGADGTVYIGGSWELYALEGATGRMLWSVPVVQSYAAPAIGADGTVYSTSFVGTLWAIGP